MSTEHLTARSIEVPDRLLSPHPLVAAAGAQLRTATPLRNGLVETDGKTTVQISVAKRSIGRALRLYDALIRAWEAAGGAIKFGVRGSTYCECTDFVIGPDRLPVHFFEKTEPVPEAPAEDDTHWHSRPPRKPTGKLTLLIDIYEGAGLRRSWSDGQRQQLETQMGEIVAGLQLQIERERAERLDRECRDRQGNRAKAHRDRKKIIREQDAERIRTLKRNANEWHEAQRIRAYLAAVRAGVEAGSLRIKDEAVYAEWSRFSTWYADHIDPLTQAKPLSQEDLLPECKPIEEVELTRQLRQLVRTLGVVDTDGLCKVTRAQVRANTKNEHWVWDEICCVLEGHGYSVRNRQ